MEGANAGAAAVLCIMTSSAFLLLFSLLAGTLKLVLPGSCGDFDQCSGPFAELRCEGNALEVSYCCGTIDGNWCTLQLTVHCDELSENISLISSGESRWHNTKYCVSQNLSSTFVGICTLFGSFQKAGSINIGDNVPFPTSSCSFAATEGTVATTGITINETTTTTEPATTSTFSEDMRPSTTQAANVVNTEDTVFVTTTQAASVVNTEDTVFVATTAASADTNRDQTLVLVVTCIGVAILVAILLLILIVLSVYRMLKIRDCRPIHLHYSPETIQKFDPDFSPVKISGTVPVSTSMESVMTDPFFINKELSSPTSETDMDSSWDRCSANSSNSYLMMS